MDNLKRLKKYLELPMYVKNEVWETLREVEKIELHALALMDSSKIDEILEHYYDDKVVEHYQKLLED